MLLLEHDAKTLLARDGIAVPPGVLIESLDALAGADLRGIDLPPGPWVVKAQVPVGGRGKAGGIRMADDAAGLVDALGAILAMRIKGHAVQGCRVESKSAGSEVFLSFAVDAAAGAVRMLFSARGGIDIESVAPGALRSALVPPRLDAMLAALPKLLEGAPPHIAAAVADAGERLAEIFLRHEALLLEINPLFVDADGSWTAGDARFALDENALPRQPAQMVLLSAREGAYTDALFKYRNGFDYIVVDPGGEIGLITTGAGLSMKIIDDLTAQGRRPYNFVDIRSGQFRGDPGRLITVMRDIAHAPNIRVVLVNIFAGITHLGEFTKLLAQALAAVPELRVPVVARLVGNGLDDARVILAEQAPAVELQVDLEQALARVLQIAGPAHG
ncbi:MAG TPA: ATP-grasp domain-containing protein [Burkholderiales bacterium]|nr:ATP-grasp domain-containing protein [Burkholderiales bacterium]